MLKDVQHILMDVQHSMLKDMQHMCRDVQHMFFTVRIKLSQSSRAGVGTELGKMKISVTPDVVIND